MTIYWRFSHGTLLCITMGLCAIRWKITYPNLFKMLREFNYDVPMKVIVHGYVISLQMVMYTDENCSCEITSTNADVINRYLESITPQSIHFALDYLQSSFQQLVLINFWHALHFITMYKASWEIDSRLPLSKTWYAPLHIINPSHYHHRLSHSNYSLYIPSSMVSH